MIDGHEISMEEITTMAHFVAAVRKRYPRFRKITIEREEGQVRYSVEHDDRLMASENGGE